MCKSNPWWVCQKDEERPARNESRSFRLHCLLEVKHPGKRWAQTQPCFQLSLSPVSSWRACLHCSALCGLRFWFDYCPHRTCPQHDLEKIIILLWEKGFFFFTIGWNIFLPMRLFRISGGNEGLWLSSPTKLFLRPWRQCVARVALSKRIISIAETYFL